MSETVRKALQLVEALAAAREAVGVSELGRQLGMHKSTVHRLLDTLTRQGYVRRAAGDGRYVLTTRLWELDLAAVNRLGIVDLARPVMDDITARSGEAALLGILEGLRVLVLAKTESPHALQIHSRVGARLLLDCTSMGKVYLAFGDEDDRLLREVLASPERKRAAVDLEADLATARRTGYTTTSDEWQVGVSGVSAPVRDAGGRIAGSLCITGPTSRIDEARMAELGAMVRAAAAALSARLGAPG